MPPRTRAAGPGEARRRRDVAERLCTAGELLAGEDAPADRNAAVGVLVLAGIAAADAICIAALGMYSVAEDHRAAVGVLHGVDPDLAKLLERLTRLKAKAHYGTSFVSVAERDGAVRAARRLVDVAVDRTRAMDPGP